MSGHIILYIEILILVVVTTMNYGMDGHEYTAKISCKSLLSLFTNTDLTG